MEIKGKVFSILPIVEGQGKNGVWQKQNFILETQEQYAKKICIALWGNNIEKYKINVGEIINVGIDIESREYNGKWFTEIKAWKIDKVNNAQETTPLVNDEPDTFINESETDDLPF